MQIFAQPTIRNLTRSRIAFALSLALELFVVEMLPSKNINADSINGLVPATDASPNTSEGGSLGFFGLGEEVPKTAGEACEPARDGKAARGIGGMMIGNVACSAS